MSAIDGSGPEQLSRLRAEARALVESMPGPLHRVVLRTGDTEVELEWWAHGDPPQGHRLNGDGVGSNGHTAVTQAAHSSTPEEPAEGAEDTHLIVAPLVGTCYLAPEPGGPPFIAVGQLIEPGQPVAIVEAMKLMNEVISDVGGRVEAILSDNAAAVEFGQPLVRLSLDVGGERQVP